ncbi:hypothetical protein Aple_051130 [Acrocarpospora pleiomorpha]|uniref:Uncharacterized protein n=1 Tax=Acrocarpospora pleiomorpha TaxID=90975 RepID=A0A5M3XNA2_9ACTN|nr:hypothetical protein [Acrocarpospora pleiomorpha]GES22216.1 hypothetical protein Aple_051130 [Acrocarpospora pleiomorpha]
MSNPALQDGPDNLADLLNIDTDPENCTACVTAHSLWPRWPHGACPYHCGINQATRTTTAPTDQPDDPRYGHSFHKVELIEVRCALCDVDATILHDLNRPDGIPYLHSIDAAAWMLPSRRWTRARDLETGEVTPFDQRWLCPACTLDHHCDSHGHQPETVPAYRNRHGIKVSACQRCGHCDAYLTQPTLTSPPRIVLLLFRVARLLIEPGWLLSWVRYRLAIRRFRRWQQTLTDEDL